MFNQLLKVSSKKLRVRFKVVDGKVHVKNLSVSPDEYKRIAEKINNVVGHDLLQRHNFSASIDVTL